MSDLDALFSGGSGLGSPCRVVKIIDSLPEPYKSKLQDLVDTTFVNGGLSETDLSRVMLDAGLKCSGSMIGRHRRGVCTCPTER